MSKFSFCLTFQECYGYPQGLIFFSLGDLSPASAQDKVKCIGKPFTKLPGAWGGGEACKIDCFLYMISSSWTGSRGPAGYASLSMKFTQG